MNRITLFQRQVSRRSADHVPRCSYHGLTAARDERQMARMHACALLLLHAGNDAQDRRSFATPPRGRLSSVSPCGALQALKHCWVKLRQIFRAYDMAAHACAHRCVRPLQVAGSGRGMGPN